MKKYKLIRLFPGLPEGAIVGDIVEYFNQCFYHIRRLGHNGIHRDLIESEISPEFFEQISERIPIGKTSDSEVYLDGVDTKVYEGLNEVWEVDIDDLTMIQFFNKKKLFNNCKYFLTKKAATEYVTLQKAIKKAYALDKSEVERYYINEECEPSVVFGNVETPLNWYTYLKLFRNITIEPDDYTTEEITNAITTLQTILKERENGNS
jgi:hypothetical protein